MKEISLTRGLFALVDDIDYEWLSRHKWCIAPGGYAVRGVPRAEHKEKGTLIYMHREILGLGYGDKRKADHRDVNRLNNKRENLRVCTQAQNTRNRPIGRDNTSGFKGVSFQAETRKWRASISVNNKGRHLGLFDTPEAAHAAYCEASKKYHGDFGRAA
jgi:hypothetical protein